MIERRVALRRKFALECSDLVSDAELDHLEKSMPSGVKTLQQARKDSYERRARAAGIPIRRSEFHDASEYGELEAMVRQEVGQLRVDRKAARFQLDKKRWTITDRLTVWNWIVVLVVAFVCRFVRRLREVPIGSVRRNISSTCYAARYSCCLTE